jgi:hypothetical protein
VIFDIVSFLFGGLCGGIVVAIVEDFLARRRDAQSEERAAKIARETQKSDFLRFMQIWKKEVEREVRREELAPLFSTKVVLLEGEVEKIRGYYGPEFEKLVSDLSSLTDSDVEELSPDNTKLIGQEKLLAKIDAIISFVRSN